MTIKTTLAIAAVLAAAQFAHASSEDSWDELFAKVKSSCIKHSGLNNVESSSEVILFQQPEDKLALVMRGPMGKANSRVNTTALCLYDRRSGRVVTSNFDWNRQ